MSTVTAILKDGIRRGSIISIGDRSASLVPSDVKYVRSDSFNLEEEAESGFDGIVSVGSGSYNPGFVEDDSNQVVSGECGLNRSDVLSAGYSGEPVNGSPFIIGQQTESDARHSKWITTEQCQPEQTATVPGKTWPCDDSKSRVPQDKLTIRDYLMACSLFLVTLITYGNTNSLSVWLIKWLDEYPQSASSILYIPNLSFALMGAFGFVDIILINRFGIYNIMLLGCFLQTISIIGSIFSTNAITLVIVVGFFLGCASCLVYMNAFILMGIAFGDAGKSLIALLSLAGPLCGIIFPNLTPILLEQYGWRGGMLLLGGIDLQMIPLALFLLLSAKYKKKRKRMKESENNLDFSIFRNPLYVAYVCVNIFSMSASTGFYSFLPAFLDKKGMKLKQAAFLYSVYCGLTAIPRALTGVIQRWTTVPFLWIFIGSVFVFGSMSILINFAESYSVLFVCCVFLSISMGGPVGLFNIGILECIGPEQYSLGTSVSETIYGIGTAILGYLAGLLIVYMDSYLEAFSIYGGLMLISNSFLFVTYLVKPSYKPKKTLPQP